MKSFVRHLAKIRHAVYANVVLGVIMVLAGLYFDLKNIENPQQNPLFEPATLMALGAAVAAVAAVLVVATYHVAPVLEGEIVVQQPQLTDVRAHAPHTNNLAKVT